VLATTLMGCAFGLIALRATGLGFLMLTLALSQVLWGTAYRWVSMTTATTVCRPLRARPPSAWISTRRCPSITIALVIGAFSIWMMARFVGSAFGATLKGARESAAQDERARLRRVADPLDHLRLRELLGAVSGLLFVYYHKYIHPVSLSLAKLCRGPARRHCRRSGTLAGPWWERP